MIEMLKSVAIFSEVARLSSFRAAEKPQCVSPFVISRHISNLENNLGEVLSNHSTRKLAHLHQLAKNSLFPPRPRKTV